jgi:4a-hydroxytetrahydrobiopterin dehydratase
MKAEGSKPAGGLASRRCEVCVPGTLPVEEARAAELFSQVDPAWEREANLHIKRRFEFRNFRDPFALATRVALLAEAQGHHPGLEMGWGYLVVTFTTHAAGGLTDNDFIMAAKIDRMVA